MAQIDHSIYFQQKSPDLLGAYQEGMSMRDMLDKRKKEQAEIEKQEKLQKAYQAGMTTNPDGTVTFDKSKTLSGIAGIDGQKAFEAQNEFAQRDQTQQKFNWEKQRNDSDLVTRGIMGVQSLPPEQRPQAWLTVKQDLAKQGIDVSQAPDQYDEGFAKRTLGAALSQKDALDEKYRYAALESQAADRKEARDERRFQAGVKLDEKKQGLQTPFGLANTEDDAKKLKDAFEMKKSFDRNLDAMIELRKKHGGGALFNRDDVGLGKTLSRDLLLQYKELAKLGVMSQADEKILNDIIPSDPLQYNSPLAAAQGQDPTLTKMQSFKDRSNQDFETRIGTRTRAGIGTVAQDSGAPGKKVLKTQTNQKTGEKRVIYEDGTSELIRANVAGGASGR
jgi:hypothetical protein